MRFRLSTLFFIVTVSAVQFAFVRLNPLVVTVGLLCAIALAGLLGLVGGAVGRVVSGRRHGWLAGAAFGINLAIVAAGYGTLAVCLILSTSVTIDATLVVSIAMLLGVFGLLCGGWMGGRSVRACNPTSEPRASSSACRKG